MMKVCLKRLPVLCCLASAWALASASSVSAEWFADVYGGATYTTRSDAVLVLRAPGATNHTFDRIKWNSSSLVGGRAGYWFETVPWFGIGLDAFRFYPDIPTQTVPGTIQGVKQPVTLGAIDYSVTAIAFDVVRFRLPLRQSQEFPNGQLQPYLTVGPALFFTRAKNSGNGELDTRTATDTSLGVKAGAGASWQFSNHIAVFGEYRFTHFRAEPVFNSTISPLRVPLESDINTHHLLGGVSFRF
jgi:opacity protein-like surface antigen